MGGKYPIPKETDSFYVWQKWREHLAYPFVDRGNIAAWDFSIGAGLTADGAEHTLDLSTIIPDLSISRVKLSIAIQDNAVGTGIIIKENGNADDINALVRYTQVANQIKYDNDSFMLDANNYVAYKITAGMDAAYIAVQGWWP